MNLKHIILCTIGIILLKPSTYADDQKAFQFQLTLQDVIEIAKDSSLNAFIEKNRYLANYWDYRSYKAEFLPTLNLTTRPFDFTRAVKQEFNWQDSSYQYFDQQNLNSYFNLSLNQNIPLTGGKIYIDSDLGRLQNFNNNGTQYSATPIRVGISQGLFDFNHLKWEKKLEPLEFQRAKKDYIQEREEIAERSVHYFFNLLLAQMSLDIEKTKFANADTLYKDGLQKYNKDSISQEDLYSLRLSKLNAENSLKRTQNWLKRSENNLISFLRLDKDASIELISPDTIPQLNIDKSRALEIARQNNPRIITFKQRRIYAERSVVAAKKSRYNADLNISFGLNQRGEEVAQTYKNLLDQERVRISLNIPIVDWGLTQKRYNLAKSNQIVSNARVEQSEMDFDQDILRTIEEFNLQKDLIRRAALADTLARKTYEIVKKRFLNGEVDIVKLNSTERNKIASRKNYVQELEQYWEYFYEIRQLTLYDFIGNRNLTFDFNELTQSNGLNPIF